MKSWVFVFADEMRISQSLPDGNRAWIDAQPSPSNILLRVLNGDNQRFPRPWLGLVRKLWNIAPEKLLRLVLCHFSNYCETHWEIKQLEAELPKAAALRRKWTAKWATSISNFLVYGTVFLLTVAVFLHYRAMPLRIVYYLIYLFIFCLTSPIRKTAFKSIC